MSAPSPSPSERFAQAARGDRARPRRIRCLNPFRWLEVNDGGEVTPCCSPWFKGSLGNVREQSMPEIWNGPAFQELREAMYDGGNWQKFCNADTCPHIQNDYWVYPDFIDSTTHDLLPITDAMLDEVRDGKTRMETPPLQVGVSCDPRCNLRCIMCSTLTNPNRDGVALRAAIDGLNAFLPTVKRIKMMGDGEVFAVPESRDFLFEFDTEANPDTSFLIHTNGILLTPKMWKKIEHITIDWMAVSIDGATKETFEKIRVGGKWDTLMANLEFLLEKHRAGVIRELHINMCVMRSNVHEMVPFAEMGKRLGVTSVYYLPVLGDYPDEQIFTPPDPVALAQVVENLRHPIMEDPTIVTDSLTPWKNWAPPREPGALRQLARRAKRLVLGQPAA